MERTCECASDGFSLDPLGRGKITVTQHEDGSITQTQEEYLATLTEIEIQNERKVHLNSLVNENERTQLRALLGGLQWLVTQSRVDCMVDVNLLQSCVATATV